MLTYLPGDTVGEGTPWPQWVSAESVLVQVGQWLPDRGDQTLHAERDRDQTEQAHPPVGYRG